MSEEQVRCTRCGRGFGARYLGPTKTCLYCGGELTGPGTRPPALAEDETEEAGKPGEVPASARRPRGKPAFEILKARGPSRLAQPTSWLQDLLALAMLSMLAGLGLGLAAQDAPLLPPRAIATAALLAPLPIMLGGRLLVFALDLLSAPARSVLLAVPLLVLGVLLGLPAALARFLVRLETRLFGLPGCTVTAVLFAAGMAWLDARHDPFEGALARATEEAADPRTDPEFRLTPSAWAGALQGHGEGSFALRFERIEGEEAQGTLSWVQSGRVDEVRAACVHNHLVVPYPGPPRPRPWWQREGMLSTLGLWIAGGRQIEGQDLVFGGAVEARRTWRQSEEQAEAALSDEGALSAAAPVSAAAESPPVLRPPVLLRPSIPVEGQVLGRGFAFALRPAPGAEALLLLPASLFGPAGGLQEALIPQMLPALCGEATFFDVLGGAMRARGEVQPPVAGAQVLQRSEHAPPDASGDLIAFTLLPGSSLEPLDLSTRPAARNQVLWLPARPTRAEAEEEALVALRVGETWERGFAVRGERPEALESALGAPLLDAEGRVAGMLVGVQGAGERCQGIALPASWIGARLAR